MMEARTWLRIRLAVMGIVAVGSGMAPLFPEDSPFVGLSPLVALGVGIVIMVTELVMIPVMIAAVISLQSANPTSAKVWTRPTHYDNPFRFSNPLLFFHFASYVIMAGGLGVLVSFVAGALTRLLEGGVIAAGGAGCLAGVHLAMRWAG